MRLYLPPWLYTISRTAAVYQLCKKGARGNKGLCLLKGNQADPTVAYFPSRQVGALTFLFPLASVSSIPSLHLEIIPNIYAKTYR